MELDLTKFKGSLPYSAELFGIYQPIIGWKSKRTKHRFFVEHGKLFEAAVHNLVQNSPGRKELIRAPHPIGPDDYMPDGLPHLVLGTETGKQFRAAAKRFAAETGHLPEGEEWQHVAESADLGAVITKLAEEADNGHRGGRDVQAHVLDTLGAQVGLQEKQFTLKQEAVVAGTLIHMANNTPAALGQLFQLQDLPLDILLASLDPLASFDPEVQAVVLSPIGLVNLFREYFFEFDTFLGPPVAHLWVSPGGSVEVYEIHTRKTLEERQVEIATEVTTKSETEVADEDEISTKISEENARDISLGVSASGSVDFSVVQASASATFGLQSNNKTSEETAHKHTRRQSEKVSNEIRRNFKTTFKTTVETEDTSSRRYLLQNATEDLVNFELRRKMRQVGVQVQHLGTQLCWQLYVDDPGFPLGISTLVHVAQPADLLPDAQPPEMPTKLPDKKDQYVFVFPFEPADEEATDDGEDEDYDHGHDIEEDPGEGLINWKKTITVPPPQNAAGYTLKSAGVSGADKVDPDEDAPSVTAECSVVGEEQFEIRLNHVNFNDQPGIRFTIDLVWAAPEPTPEVKAQYEQKMKEFDDEKKRAAHTAYVKAIRERVKLAANITIRPASDLREEERTVIFRRLIAQLTGIKDGPEPHLMAELIRAIFDVEKMLYYVAPEWWMPRMHSKQQFAPPSASDSLTEDDKVSWGGSKAWGRPNYLITEDSEPARMGASLGWMLQLDGDTHRNAFLNSPWVKAVVPIRPGREKAALNWLKRAHVEGADGLDTTYGGPEPELKGKTIEQALLALAGEVTDVGQEIENVLATETVFEHGFDPLEGGFHATGEPFEIFDQWIEVLPTDQVVAVEVHYDPKTGQEL